MIGCDACMRAAGVLPVVGLPVENQPCTARTEPTLTAAVIDIGALEATEEAIGWMLRKYVGLVGSKDY